MHQDRKDNRAKDSFNVSLILRPVLSVLLAGLVLMAAYPAHAQNLEIVWDFGSPEDDANPEAAPTLERLAFVDDSYFWGTAPKGAEFGGGGIYLVTEKEGVFGEKVVYSFTPDSTTAGSNPIGGLTYNKTNGLFYGTNSQGDEYDCGDLYAYDPSSRTVDDVYAFGSGGPTDPCGPNSTLVLGKDGDYYGTTIGGGGGYGTLFKCPPSGPCTTAYAFTAADGSGPGEPVAKGNDIFWNMVGGDLKEYDTLTGRTKNVVTFPVTLPNGSTTGGPAGPVAVGSGGTIYLTTTYGGADGFGAILEFNLKGELIGDLWDFGGAPQGDAADPNGLTPIPALGLLAGTSYSGGNSSNCPGGCGTFFKIDMNGTNYQVTSLFGGTDAGNPLDPPLAIKSKDEWTLYFATYNGGADNAGTISGWCLNYTCP